MHRSLIPTPFEVSLQPAGPPPAATTSSTIRCVLGRTLCDNMDVLHVSGRMETDQIHPLTTSTTTGSDALSQWSCNHGNNCLGHVKGVLLRDNNNTPIQGECSRDVVGGGWFDPLATSRDLERP